jgi:hypothetical protein
VFGQCGGGFKAHGVRDLLQTVSRGQHDCKADMLGAPNTIEEKSIKQTLDDELKPVEQKLLSDNNIEYKTTKRHQSQWLNYAVV